jgi:lysophospholipase L1-like esterase
MSGPEVKLARRDDVTRPRIRWRGLVVNLLLAVVSPALVLLALEASARLLHVRTAVPLVPAPANCLRRSALLSMEFRPSCEGYLHDTPFHTNSVGLRGPELSGDRPTRILAAGDSCTWGWRVADHESYPAVLQALLDRAVPGRYAVANAGVPGYTSHQGVVYLRERGLSLAPAIVLIDYGFNDQFEVGEIEAQLRLQRRLMPLLSLDDALLRRSVVYRRLRQATQGTMGHQAVRVAPERYASNLREMVGLAHAHGARTLLVDFWPLGDVRYRPALLAVSAEAAVPVVRYDGPLIDVVHPTVEGYRILAGRIWDRLAAEGYLAPSSS